MKIHSLLILLFLSVISVYSQDTLTNAKFKKYFTQAEDFISNEEYINAVDLYKKMLVGHKDNANIQFKIGYCYLNIRSEKLKALPYLEQSARKISEDYKYDDYKETNAPVDAYYYLAQAQQYNYSFDEAIFNYNKFLKYLTEQDSLLKKDVNKKISECETGKNLIQYPVNMHVKLLDTNVNTVYDEHSPIISADEAVLLFTSKRKNGNEKININGQYLENIYSSENIDGQWQSATPIFSDNNTNIATVSLSADGQTLFIYKDDNGDGNIYVSYLNGDKWSKPEKLPEVINSKYKESSASLSPDGDMLYFTSNRPGGMGGMDIYISKKLPNGEWSKAQNIGSPINTEYDEESPFIHYDGATLFYSSNGQENMGGYDILFTVNEDGKWMKPSNIGYPINTTGDDIFYMPTPDGKRAYYASIRKDGIGGSDIYLITLPDIEEKALTVFSGQVLLRDGTVPNNVVITVSDANTDEEIGVYTPNAGNGKFVLILKAGKKYNVNFEDDNDLSYTEIIDVTEDKTYNKIKKAIVLKPLIIGKDKGTYIVNFSPKSSSISDNNQINTIKEAIKNYPKAKVSISYEENSDTQLRNKRKAMLSALILSDYPRVKIIDKNQLLASDTVINVIFKSVESNTNNDELNANNDKPKQTYGEVQQLGNDFVINTILFDFDKYTTDKYDNTLKVLAKYLKHNKDAKIKIIGYADAQGSYEYNLILTKKRANFVKNYLIKQGVDKNQILTEAKSNTNFISKNLNPESRKYNRRVEFEIIKQGKEKIKIEPIKVPEKYKL